MPRKAKAKSAADVESPKVSQTQTRKKSVPRGKQPEAPRGVQATAEAMGGGTIYAGYFEPGGSSAMPGTVVTRWPMPLTTDHAGKGDIPAPRSAWILFGSDISFPSDDNLAQTSGRGEWTAPKNVEIGDTLFIYFISPKKAIHFVARAASKSFPGEEPLSTARVGASRWWVKYDSMIRIRPISLNEIREVFQEKWLLLYCADGKYLRPDFANRLLERPQVAFAPTGQCTKNSLRRVIGKKELGDPKSITLDGLRRLQSSAFIYEEDVEYHVLEPLLRLARVKAIRRYDIQVKIRNRLRYKTADYAVLDGPDKVLCIIEVKLDPCEGKDWERNRDLLQAREYAKKSKAPVFVLIDRDRVFCFRTHDELPCLTIDRRALDEDGLSALRAHILGERRADASSGSRG